MTIGEDSERLDSDFDHATTPLLAQIATIRPAITPFARSRIVTKIFLSPYPGEDAAR